MPPAVPIATYRLQLHAKFGFDEAAALVPYLRRLGVSHVYASPFLTARAGSTHGYDIVDHRSLNPEFGGAGAFARLVRNLQDADMGLILDFVPNHMGVGRADNTWWLDVLEWGPQSEYAPFFDIEWSASPYGRRDTVVLPILGTSYGEALERGDIVLAYDREQGGFYAHYYQHRLPIRPQRYGDILRSVVASAAAAGEPAGRELLELAGRFPGPHMPSPQEAPGYKSAIAAVAGGAEVIERGLGAYRPAQGHAELLALHRLLERQWYRLAYWRVAMSEINYRRFFDINDLAGIRVEDRRTFEAIHPLVFELIERGQLHGLRLDHIDGLYDPAQYCRRLQRLIRAARAGERADFYVVMEKILGEDEPCPRFAGVAGTTGYEWLNTISRVLVHSPGLGPLQEGWRAFVGERRGFDEILRDCKALVLDNVLLSEFTVLARLLARIAAGHWRTRDYTYDSLRAALRAYIVQFPVYRTYVTADGASTRDRRIIERAIDDARQRWSGPDAEIFDFLRGVLTLDLIAAERGHSAARVRRFALKVQQLTGPMMAKSFEDTALYRYAPLLALNEVGGHPHKPGLDIDEFHRRMAARANEWPHGMTATATHDTKRGEDARARLLALSEMPEAWREAVNRWRVLNEAALSRSDARVSPATGHEYLFYQSLLGAWSEAPGADLIPRMQAYLLKAARESKTETSWLQQDAWYEEGLTKFVAHVLDAEHSRSFVGDFAAFARRAALAGALNSLSQLALKLALPGVPDFHQGTELWDLSLVDPDNRRAVDFAERQRLLHEVEHSSMDELVERWDDGRLKLSLTQRLLQLRNEQRDLFRRGDYRPVLARGTHARNVIAFSRNLGGATVVVAVGRQMFELCEYGTRWPRGEVWKDTSLELDLLDPMRDVIQGRAVSTPKMSELFAVVPVAVLILDKTERAGPDRLSA